MTRTSLIAIIPLAVLLCSGSAIAQITPIGLWKVIDDDTKQPLSQVRISAEKGTLSGKIEKLLDTSRPHPTCSKCTDERKGQAMLGMTIMRNVKAAGDGTWEGGEILDPNNGKVYRVRLQPLDAGTVLEVRGYIGPFFRNQHWQRVE